MTRCLPTRARSGSLRMRPRPLYYRSGLYRELARDPRIELTAIFSSSAGVRPGDLGYGRPALSFDADALSGFRSAFLRRAERTEPRGGFFDLATPTLSARSRAATTTCSGSTVTTRRRT